MKTFEIAIQETGHNIFTGEKCKNLEECQDLAIKIYKKEKVKRGVIFVIDPKKQKRYMYLNKTWVDCFFMWTSSTNVAKN